MAKRRRDDVEGRKDDARWGPAVKQEEEVVEKEPANFGLTGNLAKDARTGNTRGGIVLKWSEPVDAAQPTTKWRLYVFKDEDLIQTLHIHRQSAFLIGRDDRVADILLDHPSCSKQHAVIQHRLITLTEPETNSTTRIVKPYLLDLASANKTRLNGVEVEDSRFIELREKDVLRFGASSREYVLVAKKTDTPTSPP